MVHYVPDKTGRFSRRPHYRPEELDRECESIITKFLKSRHDEVKYPILTEDLTILIERDAEDLDLFADLSTHGNTVEGVTVFRPGRRPSVRISQKLSGNERYKNRLRTTLTHEYGHVHYHSYLWELEPPGPDLLRHTPHADKRSCKNDSILDAGEADWMEWQAGYACGALLMPATPLRMLVRQYHQSFGIYGPVNPHEAHGRNLIDAVQKAFDVSADAARVRLLKLKVLSAVSAGPSLFSR
jgi:hypothetical protein